MLTCRPKRQPRLLGEASSLLCWLLSDNLGSLVLTTLLSASGVSQNKGGAFLGDRERERREMQRGKRPLSYTLYIRVRRARGEKQREEKKRQIYTKIHHKCTKDSGFSRLFTRSTAPLMHGSRPSESEEHKTSA